jgi:hypothetical protein
VDGPGRRHYRLFCVVDSKAKEAAKPYLTVIGGLDKPFKSVFSVADYAHIRALRDEYLSKNPRSLAA